MGVAERVRGGRGARRVEEDIVRRSRLTRKHLNAFDRYSFLLPGGPRLLRDPNSIGEEADDDED